ncbi:uncharacterized protein BDZ99DRAFT_479777 [Mytilinidion resinicola]|uniref:C2H2-type domain-containing protein n=1 Tax=Mytilinidion resinicola TaxID=574789 RepID=A0A6A6YCK0_9PEZI|nr:uncharacterized protein BDZ99DRAFT_479777 [Mytilinidion resinicola]KAF2806542.1 hypothetical protein BDZ99DRAFT_479777 [Mytilinidion resinicola]
MTTNSSPQVQAINVKPVYHCRWCEKTFSRRDHRQRHERAHTKERPFLCHLCAASFGRRDILQRHCIHVHGALASDERDALNRGDRLKAQAARPSKKRRISDAADALPTLAFAADEPVPVDPASIKDQLDQVARRYVMLDNLDQLEMLSQVSPGPPDLDTSIWSVLCEYFDFPVSPQASAASQRTEAILECPPTEPQLQRASSRVFERVTGLTPPPPSFMQSNRSRGLMPPPQITVPRSIGGGIDFALQQIDTGRILTNYTSHIAPGLPMLHLPTIDLSPWIKHGHSKCDGCCLPNGSVVPARRRVNRCLMISLLTLGAICDHRHALAERLFRESGPAIREYLKEIRLNKSDEPPPLDLIQALTFYIAYGLCSGSKQIEESMLGHMSCLGSLVQDAQLSKPMSEFNYGPMKPGPDDDWFLWAAEEERKRTYFAVLVCQSSAVNYLNIQPYLHSKGIEWTLPVDEDLWEARTAASWRELRRRTPDAPRFKDELALLFANPAPSFKTVADFPTSTTGEHQELESDEPHFAATQAVTDISTNRRLPSQYGCLVLIGALNVMVWEHAHGRTFTFGLTAGGLVRDKVALLNKSSLSNSLRQWQEMWQSYPKHYSHEDARYRILATCVPLLDHAELLLHVDIAQAKDALFSRDYQKTSMAYSSLPMVIDDSDDVSFDSEADSPRYEQVHHKKRCYGLRGAAAYAVKALELAFRIGPWFSSEDACYDAPIQSVVAMFYCTQVVSSWLLAYSTKYHQDVDVTNPRREQIEDKVLLKAIKQLISHRNQTSLPFEDDTISDFSMELFDEMAILQLAIGLITAHVQLLKRVSFWPPAAHLIEALQVRANAIQEMSKLVQPSKPDHQSPSLVPFLHFGESDTDADGWSLQTTIPPCAG